MVVTTSRREEGDRGAAISTGKEERREGESREGRKKGKADVCKRPWLQVRRRVEVHMSERGHERLGLQAGEKRALYAALLVVRRPVQLCMHCASYTK